MTSQSFATNEFAKFTGTGEITRTFAVSVYNPNSQVLQATGPDGQVLENVYDNRGRLTGRQRYTPEETPDFSLEESYTYDDADRVIEIVKGHGAGAKVGYVHDAAGRVTQIRHRTNAGATLLQIDYTWNTDNTVATRVETEGSDVSITTFTYDARQRLTREERELNSAFVYAIDYTYDQLGNRLTKFVDRPSTQTDWLTQYYYDIDNPDPTYQTRNNRLRWYTEKEVSGSTETLKRTVNYTYWKRGDVSNITITDAAAPLVRRDLSFNYNNNGSLWIAMWSHWQVDGNGAIVETSFAKDAAREFRFGSARGRYVVRDVDPDTLEPVETQQWTDYLGDEPWNDFDVDTATADVTPTRAYLPGAGQYTHATGDTHYYHADLIGSTNLLTDEVGAVTGASAGGTGASRLVYTAFGEPLNITVTAGGGGTTITVSIGGDNPTDWSRYGYAGAHGYESGLLSLQGEDTSLPSITLQHVGHRWYQPGIGRFVQRDPIGLGGGLNLYVYCNNNPNASVDPLGLWDWWEAAKGAVGGAIGGAIGGLAAGAIGGAGIGAIPGAIAGGVIGGIVGGITGGITESGLTGTVAGTGAGVLTGILSPYILVSFLPGSTVVTVTHWGATTGIVAGNWVMLGGAGIMQYLLSGKCQWWGSNQFASFGSRVSSCVPLSSLRWPGGWEWWKGLIGQRQFIGQ